MYKNRNIIFFFIKTKENKKTTIALSRNGLDKMWRKKNGDKRSLGSGKKLARELECWK